MILLVVGVMDLRAMALVTAAITAERFAPIGARIVEAIGVVVIGAGLVLIAHAAGLAWLPSAPARKPKFAGRASRLAHSAGRALRHSALFVERDVGKRGSESQNFSHDCDAWSQI
jgi:hypothetical protein